MAIHPMSRVYRRLQAVGLPRAYVLDTVLPEWWEEGAAETPAGLSETLMRISRHTGLDFASLRDSEDPPRFSTACVKFKKPSGKTESDVVVARGLAAQVACLVAIATRHPLNPELPAAESLRDEILAAGAAWVDLRSLAERLWALGIPVVHIAHFPVGAKKMDAITVHVEGRPVIVVCNRKPAAWLLFDVAHEFGHIALGHVSPGEALTDASIRQDTSDADERAASAFASELLTGERDLHLRAARAWPKGERLAKLASSYGAQHAIDPGHIVLNYANSMGPTFYGVAQKALKLLESGSDGASILNELAVEQVEWTELPEESCEFLMKMLGRAP